MKTIRTVVSASEAPPNGAGPCAQAIKIIISDSNHINCELMSTALKRSKNNFEVLGWVTGCDELLNILKTTEPDVVLINAHLNDGPASGFRALRLVRETNPSVHCVLMLDTPVRDLVVDAFRAGAKGVFCRSEPFQSLCRCINAVHGGQIWAGSLELQFVLDALAEAAPLRVVNAKGENLLTRRELQVVSMVAEGMTNREISQKLKLSEHTVKNHLFRIFEKLGISSRVELVLYVAAPRNKAA